MHDINSCLSVTHKQTPQTGKIKIYSTKMSLHQCIHVAMALTVIAQAQNVPTNSNHQLPKRLDLN